MSWTITPQQRFTTSALLDRFPGAAAAYSLRNLVGTSNPNVVRVRRSSDNAEQDFTAAQVTDGTLTTFCGAGNGFVRTWYDQSGNNYHLGQATTDSQPQIVSSGALVLTNTKPAVSFDTDWLAASSAFPTQSNNSIFYVASSTGGNTRVLDTRGTGLPGITGWQLKFSHTSADVDTIDTSSGITINSANITRTGQKLATSLLSQTRVDSYTNGSLSATGTGSVSPYNSGNSLYMAANVNGQNAQLFIGTIQEAIIYTSSKSAERAAIESSINAHYAIY